MACFQRDLVISDCCVASPEISGLFTCGTFVSSSDTTNGFEGRPTCHVPTEFFDPMGITSKNCYASYDNNGWWTRGAGDPDYFKFGHERADMELGPVPGSLEAIWYV